MSRFDRTMRTIEPGPDWRCRCNAGNDYLRTFYPVEPLRWKPIE